MKKSTFFRKFDQKRNFSKILTNIKISRKFHQNQSSKFLNKSKFLKILTKIGIFRKFDQNRNFSKIWLKSVFRNLEKNFDQNRHFFENLTKIDIFRTIWPKSKFFENLTKIEIFENFIKIRVSQFSKKFWPKSKLFLKFVQNRNFETI